MKLKLHWQILIAIILGWAAGKLSGVSAELFGITFYSAYDFFAAMFLNALKMIVVPLVVSSMITGVGGIASDAGLERMGLMTFTYFIITSVLAILTGLIMVNIIAPGIVEGQAVERLLGLASLPPDQVDTIKNADMKGIVEVFLRMVPPNIVDAAQEGQLLGLITFSLLFGYSLRHLKPPYHSMLLGFWQATYTVMMDITRIIILFAPLGVFALIAKMAAVTGYEAFQPLILFFLTVVIALAIHFFVTLPAILKYIARVSPLRHYAAMAPALMTAFSTSSSSATLPVTIECVEENAGVSNKVSSFVLPLGATINMDGTALYECVAAMFIAQVYGLELGFSQQFIIAFTALVTSIGVAGIPSASLVAIAIILGALGLPLEGIGVILAVDRVLDMLRTSVNIFGDSCGAVLIAKLQGEEGVLLNDVEKDHLSQAKTRS
jgi:proton glutamate symport protein